MDIFRIVFGAAVVLATVVPERAMAWDDQGHMMVAAVAYDRLTPQTKARVAELLKLNKFPTNGANNAAPADAAKAAFMMAATSPDAIKRDPHFKNDGEEPTKVPNADQNTGFGDTLMHKYWHYIDLPYRPDGGDTSHLQPPAVNARERIGLFRKTIASTSASDDVKAYDLVWLIHLVGDVHQPLHATSRFTGNPLKGDNGGNAVTLCAAPCKDELHTFWDDALGTSKSVSAAMSAAARLPAPNASDAAKSDETLWVAESFQDAKDMVYKPPVGPGRGPYTLNATYQQKARALAQERVALAGARLANLLNNELK